MKHDVFSDLPKAYDATHLVKTYSGSQLDILIDQGKDDQFLSAGQLLPDNFIAACTERKIPVVFRLQEASIGTHWYYEHLLLNKCCIDKQFTYSL